MALSKVNFNSLNVTPSASKVVKFNSNNNGLETGDVGGSLVLISEQTASSSANISFTSGIDSTYKEYIFKFIDVHPQNDGVFLTFQADTGTNTNYNQTITSTHFTAYHFEDGSSAAVSYITGGDQAQGSSFQRASQQIGNDSDQAASGSLHLFDPSNAYRVKQFIVNTASIANDDGPTNTFSSGYFNTTTALTRVQFKMSGGNIDAGTFKMYGVS